jgi:hypothetical protein
MLKTSEKLFSWIFLCPDMKVLCPDMKVVIIGTTLLAK